MGKNFQSESLVANFKSYEEPCLEFSMTFLHEKQIFFHFQITSLMVFLVYSTRISSLADLMSL